MPPLVELRFFPRWMLLAAVITMGLLASSPVRAQPVRVACVGDSITFGRGIRDRGAHSYPAQLQGLLGDAYEVRNFGRSGSAVMAATRTSGGQFLASAEHREALAFAPRIVVVNLGINDLDFYEGREAQFEREYAELMRVYRGLRPVPRVFVWSPLAPLTRKHRLHGLYERHRASIARRIASAAKEAGAETIDLHAPLVKRPGLFPDAIHPNASGAAVIALVTARAIGVVSKGLLSVDSFETLVAGDLGESESQLGTWSAEKGHAEIDRHHRYSGRQCLHIFGGKDRVVELRLAGGDRGADSLSFQAERWTRNAPFEFVVETLRDDEWSVIYRGDRAIKVGGFLTRVKIDGLDFGVGRIRFRCTSREKSGILIDDVRVTRRTPMRVRAVKAEHLVAPVLIGNPASPVLRLRVDAEGSLESLSVTSVRVSTAGTTSLSDVESISCYYTGSRSTLSARESYNPDLFHGAKVFGEPASAAPSLVFRGSQALAIGANYFWVAFRLRSSADQDHVVDAACDAIELSSGDTRRVDFPSPAGSKRIGVALRKGGDDGVTSCRIPGLATTNAGTLIAVYDCRNRSGGDLPGDIDVGMSRSVDGGRTWEPMRRIIDFPREKDRRHGNGVGDPSILVDRRGGTIWVAALWSHGNRGWNGSGPGMTPAQTGQFVLAKSEDDGKTWSDPVNITEQIKDPRWRLLLQGPGMGITLLDGTLVFPAQFRDPKGMPHSTIIYSKNGGKRWQIGTGAKPNTTEAQVVELRDGALMLNMRDNRRGSRSVYVTRDLGRTWTVHATSRKALPEPVCMASLIRFGSFDDKRRTGPLLFSNPSVSRAPRRRITLKASVDDGVTWPERWHLLLDEGIGAGYSCLTRIDEDTIGILYEGSQAHLVFQRIKLGEVLDAPAKTRKPKERASLLPREKSLSLAGVFLDHMVLQRELPIHVWGHAPAGQRVAIEFGAAKAASVADSDGRFSTRLPARSASDEPLTLVVRAGEERVVVRDILVGEVWLCAGQSNMEWPLSKSSSGAEALKAASRPRIRLLQLRGAARGGSGVYSPELISRLSPDAFCQGRWEVCSPSSAGAFSAVGYYFGEAIERELGVPVGLIDVSIGGTPIEAWIRREAIGSDPQLRRLVAGRWLENDDIEAWCRKRALHNLGRAIEAGASIPGDDLGPNHSFKPGFMWSASVDPLIPFALRGVLWYQGESNAESASQVARYGRLFELLVRDWRARWEREDLPFIYAQLPALRRPNWPAFREQQRRLLDRIPATGMAVTIDLGSERDVHPALKRPVGERLARWAQVKTYGRNVGEACGPLIRSARRDGFRVVLRFDHAKLGILASDGKPLRHFEVAGEDGVFHGAVARVDENAVRVSSAEVPVPKRVRYAWVPYPTPPVNFLNADGLPASPFSVDVAE